LSSLLESAPLPRHILLIAEDQEHLDTLYNLLPDLLVDDLSEIPIETQLAQDWDSLTINRYDALDLRQGSFARQLPWQKWWQEWRVVTAVAAVALVAYVG